MRVVDHIEFTARHGPWLVGERLEEMEEEKIAKFLARISNTVNNKLPDYLTVVIDVEGVRALLGEGELWEVLKHLRSPGTSRKLNALIREEDKKLRKILGDVAKALLVRLSLANLAPVDYPVEPISEVRVKLPYEEEHVNFTAKHDRWIVVKRLMIDEKTSQLDVARLLASINETAVSKIPVYARIDVKGIKNYFSTFKKVRKEEDIKALAESLEAFPAEEFAPKEFKGFAARHALGVALSKLGLPLDVPAKVLEKYLEKSG
ncbi:DUF2666 family protein [Pyrococcus yayanosii]|uniref:DUF2666 domain-containing protein n=1 Tax=Pyrococcus yayanosii (strain CH1 / JCM 16557) TaxID=529709 RepID=F8AGG1_PYRYC|nr:DUF2666 family protein [Pyrococcus yayanosii]AEH25160.1 hypothetical protein PYCH_14920 [Pyrococcus yayanosii CH1]